MLSIGDFKDMFLTAVRMADDTPSENRIMGLWVLTRFIARYVQRVRRAVQTGDADPKD